MSSVSGRIAAPYVGPYAASKHALTAIAASLRQELRPWNIHVSVLEPGNVDTPIGSVRADNNDFPPDFGCLLGIPDRADRGQRYTLQLGGIACLCHRCGDVSGRAVWVLDSTIEPRKAGDVVVTRDLPAVLNLAVSLAAQAGRLQMDQRRLVTEIQTKAHANDLVSQVDFASEKLIVDAINAAFPGDGILGEEGSDITGDSGWRWVIDPLDGTLNYLTGAGPWSVSIALQHQQRTVLGVVHDPALGETFTATAGNGAELNNVPIHVTTTVALAESIIGFSFNPSLPTRRRLGPLLADLLPIIGDIRRVPSALGLSYLAAGRFHGSFILNTKPWDIAASEMIAREAGAIGSSAGSTVHEMAVFAGPTLLDGLVTIMSRHLPQI